MSRPSVRRTIHKLTLHERYRSKILGFVLFNVADAEIKACREGVLSAMRVPFCAASCEPGLCILAVQRGRGWRRKTYESVPIACRTLSFDAFEAIGEELRRRPELVASILSTMKDR